MIHSTRDARKVLDVLSEYGVDVPLGRDQRFDLEVACSLFFPNHIIGVVRRVLDGGNAFAKLNRAQQHGWRYFSKPVRDQLKGRVSAQHAQSPDAEIKNEAWANTIYGIVMTAMVGHDINRREGNILIYEVPALVNDRQDLLAAIQICKNQDARSIPYLQGVLVREEAKRVARKHERDRMASGSLFQASADTISDTRGLAEEWLEKSKDVDLIESVERYAAENPRRRDGT